MALIVDADPKVTAESGFVSAVEESSDGDECVRGVVYEGDLPEDRSEVDEVGAAMFGVISECDVKRFWPWLGSEIEASCCGGMNHGDVCASVGNAVVFLIGDVDCVGAWSRGWSWAEVLVM